MKYEELSQKNNQQLQKDLAELRDKAEEVRRKKKLGQIKNMHELANIRKDIARIMTYLRAN